jgi:glycosyltransferase involved in cell wall biosynthesis
MKKTSYLFIPHAPATRLKTRADELSRALAAQGHEVEIMRRRPPHTAAAVADKLLWHAGELFRGVHVSAGEPKGAEDIFPPTLHHASAAQRLFDRYLVSPLLQRRAQEVTVSSAFGGPSFPGAGARTTLVYDYVDDHASGWRNAGHEQFARTVDRFVARELSQADHVIASSSVQVEEVRRRYGRIATYVPNGANVPAIRAAIRAQSPREPGAPLRVLYMGGLDYFVNLEWPLAAIEHLRARGLEAELWIAGEGPALAKHSLPPWAHALGFFPPAEIPALLSRADLGIVPFSLNTFTHAALPLKVLEYGAARLLTVSSPLAELQQQRLPWVRFAAPDSASWCAALESAAEEALATRWNLAWDEIADEFCWSHIAARLDAVVPKRGGNA